MNYIKTKDKRIGKITANHQKWYFANSPIWGERYMREKHDILTEERNKKETRIILKYLPENCRKILDAPCGYGRVTNILASRGYSLTGIDISKYFINIAKNKAAKKGLKVSYLVGNIIKKKLSEKFDAVLNIFTSIGYLENDRKNELFIKQLCHYVKPGGRLIIETINPIALLTNYKIEDSMVAKDGTSIYFKRFFDIRTSTNITKIREVEPNGKSINLVHVIRLYYPHELINICRKFGCNLIEMLDQNGKTKEIKNSLRIWLIFKKKK